MKLNHFYQNSVNAGNPISLDDFSVELSMQLKQLRKITVHEVNAKIQKQGQSMGKKGNQNIGYSYQNQINLPFIKPIQKLKKKKKEICVLPLIENIANRLDSRLQRLQKNNQTFMDTQKYKSILSYQPPSPKPNIIFNPQYIPMPFNIPMPIPMPIPMYGGGYPSLPMNMNNMSMNGQYQFPNIPMGNNFGYENFMDPSKTNNPKPKNKKNQGSQKKSEIYSENNNQVSKQKRKNTMEQKLKIHKANIRRRLRVSFLAVYFMFLFPTYCRTVKYNKFLKFVQIQEIISLQFEGLQADLFRTLVSQDFFDTFRQITRASQTKMASKDSSSANIYIIQIDKEQVEINVKSFQDFFQYFLKDFKQKLKNGSFKALMPLFVNFLDGGYAFDSIFFMEQLSAMSFTLPQRKINIPPQLAKSLIMNFAFIKIILSKFLCKKEVLNILYRIYRKKPEQKKYTLLYGKKLTIALVLFYKAINKMFFQQIETLKGNYSELSNQQKILPMNSLNYEFSLSQQATFQANKEKHQKQLIKHIKSPKTLQIEFFQTFNENWLRYVELSELIYQEALVQKGQELLMIKQQALEQDFPPRTQINNLDYLRKFRQKQNQGKAPKLKKMTEADLAFKGYATIRRIKQKSKNGVNEETGQQKSKKFEQLSSSKQRSAKSGSVNSGSSKSGSASISQKSQEKTLKKKKK